MQTAAFLSPSTSRASARSLLSRWGDSKMTRVCGESRSISRKRFRGPDFLGGNPLKVYPAVESPDSRSATGTALGPGTTSSSCPACFGHGIRIDVQHAGHLAHGRKRIPFFHFLRSDRETNPQFPELLADQPTLEGPAGAAQPGVTCFFGCTG